MDMRKIVDNTLLCRTCLAVGGDVKLVDLNDPIQKTNLEEKKGVTHMDCLIYCMHFTNAPGMPAAIYLIVYKCQLCPHESRGRLCLSEHYLLAHNLTASAEQLKPKPLSSLEIQKQRCVHDNPQINENTERHSTTASKPMLASISTNEVHRCLNKKMLTENGPLKQENLGDQAASSNCDSILENKVKLNKPMSLQLAQNDVAQMDVDDLIVEESVNSSEEMLGDTEYSATGGKYVANADHKMVNNIKCKTCIKSFSTQRELKAHMLSHNGI
ncbi:hypothetical protein GQX74_011077 [Glossina fuscipes]|nr:hypothetical protein GQX74_011077 [Glossina fuscipes]